MSFIFGSNYFIYANNKVLFKDVTDIYFWISYYRFTSYHFSFYISNRYVIHLSGMSKKRTYILLNELKKYFDIKEKEPLAKTTKELQFLNKYGKDAFEKRQMKIDILTIIFALILCILFVICD